MAGANSGAEIERMEIDGRGVEFERNLSPTYETFNGGAGSRSASAWPSEIFSGASKI
jgi:hypothetical protein